MLARALTSVDDSSKVEAALKGYQDARLERASQIQLGSRGNQWLKAGGNADWVYGYDAWSVAGASA